MFDQGEKLKKKQLNGLGSGRIFKSVLIFFVFLFGNFEGQIYQAQGGLLYDYSRLVVRDMDQMAKLIKEKIKESRSTGGNKTIPLKEALQAIYSRPNDDMLIEKIVSPLKNELEDHEAWESSLSALIVEAIGALKNPKAFNPKAQVSYGIFLENMLSELKPRISYDFEKGIITKIKDAKIKITKEADKEIRLRLMRGLDSPSVKAEIMLKEYEKEEKAQKEEEAKIKEKEKEKEQKED